MRSNVSTKSPRKLQQQKPKSVSLPKEIKNNSSVWWALATIFVATLIIYFDALKYAYVWDDSDYIVKNESIRSFNWESIKLFFTTYYVGNYQPITILTYAIETAVMKGSSFLLHFDNVILHLLNSYLVFLLIRKISPKRVEVALITAAFFAVHPMHVESVAWISERKDVLYSFFFLLSLNQYCNYHKSFKSKYLFYAFFLFLFSCMSKSAAVILPLVLLLLDYYFNRKLSWKMGIEKLPFFAISLLFGFIALHSQQAGISDTSASYSFFERISIISFSVICYLLKAFVPFYQSAIYPYPLKIDDSIGVLYFLSPIALTLFLYFVWFARRWGRDVLFAFGFFVITIFLVLQFLPVGIAIMADRYTYIPYVAVFFLVGKYYEYLSQLITVSGKSYKRYFGCFLLFVFFAFTICSTQRVKCWENNETLFTDVINKYDYVDFAYYNRAYYYSEYFAQEKYAADPTLKALYLKKSIVDYDAALRCNPIYVKAYNNKGMVLNLLGNSSEAILTYSKGLAIAPKNEVLFFNRGIAKAAIDDHRGAINDYESALYYKPTYSQAYNNKGFSLMMLGDFRAAIIELSKAIEMGLADASVYCNRGVAKGGLNDFDGAIADYGKAINLNPSYVNAYNARALAYCCIKNYLAALDDYNKVLELNPQDKAALQYKTELQSMLKNSIH